MQFSSGNFHLLYFNEHLNIVLNKAKYKLYKLQQLAYCKYYQFSTHTIFKLYESVIQPKLEYGLVTIANENKINILETFRRKAAKIALKAKKQLPTIYIDEFLNSNKIEYRLDVARIKLWNAYSRAPPTLLKHSDTMGHPGSSRDGSGTTLAGLTL